MVERMSVQASHVVFLLGPARECRAAPAEVDSPDERRDGRGGDGEASGVLKGIIIRSSR